MELQTNAFDQKKNVKYPIGIQTFEHIIVGGYAYADKTRYVYNLVSSGAKQVFLSRPRRFGKSLLLSTLQSYFEGRKDLFENLALGRLEKEWESYPVLRFSFGGIEPQSPSKVANAVNLMLRDYEKKFDVEINDGAESFGARFGLLIKNVAEKTGKQVVVLIDEYDKGIVDVLRDEENRDSNTTVFRPFYAQLKDQDQYLRFVFLTGVSRFRNLTLFSSPNQLLDISMDENYAAICGLTQEELDTDFATGVHELAERRGYTIQETKDLLKLKYDGYRFTEAEVYLYNPFSILNCLYQRRLDNYWLESGPSRVFIEYLKHSDYNLQEIEDLWVAGSTLGGQYSLEDPIPLLFQTGYLTIADYDDDMYRLKIPNGEVKSALVEQLVPLYLGVKSNDVAPMVKKIRSATENGDANELMLLFQQLISRIPHQNFRHNEVEHIYHLSISLICQMAGINARSEVSVAGGDIDMLIENRRFVYIFEFKKDHSAEEALKQIEEKGYAIPWKADGRTVIKIGVEFSSSNRNISNWIIA